MVRVVNEDFLTGINLIPNSGIPTRLALNGSEDFRSFTFKDEEWFEGTSFGYVCMNCTVKLINRVEVIEPNILNGVIDSFTLDSLETYYVLNKNPYYYSVSPFNYQHK